MFGRVREWIRELDECPTLGVQEVICSGEGAICFNRSALPAVPVRSGSDDLTSSSDVVTAEESGY